MSKMLLYKTLEEETFVENINRYYNNECEFVRNIIAIIGDLTGKTFIFEELQNYSSKIVL